MRCLLYPNKSSYLYDAAGIDLLNPDKSSYLAAAGPMTLAVLVLLPVS